AAYGAGETAVVRVTIKNQGSGSTVNGFSVDLFKDQPALVDCGTAGSVNDGRATVAKLNGGATTAFNMSFAVPTGLGAFTLRLFVDSICEIVEADEDNNQSTFSYSVSRADLIVQSIVTDKPIYLPNELGRATITVKNQGSA